MCFLCANMCQGGIFGLVMNLWTRLGVFFGENCVCVGEVYPAFLKLRKRCNM